MKTLIMTTLVLSTVAVPVFAAGDMGDMPMGGQKMRMPTPGMTEPGDHTMADAIVKKVDLSTGMVTLQHGALDNVGMPAMTMAFKTKNAAMGKQVHEGDKVKVRVENQKGTMTIVQMEKQSQ